MRNVLLILLWFAASSAWSAVYKCVDASGKVTYSSIQESGKQCTEVTAPISVVESQKPVASPSTKTSSEGEKPKGKASSEDAPKSAGDKAASRAQDIAEAEKALAEAKKRLLEQEAIRLGDERNYQRVLDRLKPFQDAAAKAEARLKELREGRTP